MLNTISYYPKYFKMISCKHYFYLFVIMLSVTMVKAQQIPFEIEFAGGLNSPGSQSTVIDGVTVTETLSTSGGQILPQPNYTWTNLVSTTPIHSRVLYTPTSAGSINIFATYTFSEPVDINLVFLLPDNVNTTAFSDIVTINGASHAISNANTFTTRVVEFLPTFNESAIISGGIFTQQFNDCCAASLGYRLRNITSFTMYANPNGVTPNPAMVFAMEMLRDCVAGNVAPALTDTTIDTSCPSLTADLTSITATNLPTGATLTWHTSTPATQANQVSDPTSVVEGTYYAAFYSPGNDCFSDSGDATTAVSVVVASCPSDLGIVLNISDGIISGPENLSVLVRVRELLGNQTESTSDIEIRLDRINNLGFTYDPSLTAIPFGSSTEMVDNAAWSYDGTDPFFHIWRNTVGLAANEQSTFGFEGVFNPNSSDGTVVLTARLVAGSGGESDFNNNLSTFQIVFFVQ